jgi:hypothetical protein
MRRTEPLGPYPALAAAVAVSCVLILLFLVPRRTGAWASPAGSWLERGAPGSVQLDQPVR